MIPFLLAVALLYFVFQGQTSCYSEFLLTSYFCIRIPYDGKDISVVVVSSRSSCRSSQNWSNSSSLPISGCSIDLDYCDVEWFALETNRDPSVIFEIAPMCCILDPFVDHDGYSISSKGFLPAVVDIMVI